MNLTEIRQSLVDRLAPLRDAGFAVRGLPNRVAIQGETVGTGGSLAHDRHGQILVRWRKDDFQEPSGVGRAAASLGSIQQFNRMTWIVECRFKTLNNQSGADEVLMAIARLILGFKPPGCQKIYLDSREFMGRDGDEYVFETRFIVPCVAFEFGNEEEVLGALLAEVQFDIEVEMVVPDPDYEAIAL